MKKLMLIIILLVTFGSPALAMEPMSNGELKKATAQISVAAKLPALYPPASAVIGFIVKGIDNYKIADDLMTGLGPVGTAVELTTPVIEFTGVANDANDLKSVATFGFF